MGVIILVSLYNFCVLPNYILHFLISNLWFRRKFTIDYLYWQNTNTQTLKSWLHESSIILFMLQQILTKTHVFVLNL